MKAVGFHFGNFLFNNADTRITSTHILKIKHVEQSNNLFITEHTGDTTTERETYQVKT